MARGVWRAAKAGDLGEVQRLVGHDPGLLNARDVRRSDSWTRKARSGAGWTPLMFASAEGHLGVVQWLVDKGAAVNERENRGYTAVYLACALDHAPVARFLVEKGADLNIVAGARWDTPLIEASWRGHLEVVRFLLGLPATRPTLNRPDRHGTMALWWACNQGHGGVVRALLASGADPTIANGIGITPMAVAKQAHLPPGATPEGRRECVAALKVSFSLSLLPAQQPSCDEQVLRRSLLFPPRLAGGGAGLPPVEGPAGGRPAGERRGGGRGGARREGGGGAEGARGLGGARPQGGLVSRRDGADGVRGMKGGLFPELMDFIG
jgi:hypothetical protein